LRLPSPPQVLVIGGGMITHDQILPSLLHLRRRGEVAAIDVVAQHRRTVERLKSAPVWQRAFPHQDFAIAPTEGDDPQPKLYREFLGRLAPRQLVVVATPDQLHFEHVMAALEHDQHVCCVKPLVLTARESAIIEAEAQRRGLLVAIEYHKRLDDRSLMARARYRQGLFGDFKLGTAALMEKWYYRHSNFQNWCTVENSDAFTYIGCHYVDLVHFITGLKPVAVSVYALRDRYPNGNEGFLWTDARVLWENGAALNVQNSLSFPDAAPGSNTQGIAMYFGTAEGGAWLAHSDQYRGLQHSYTRAPGGEGTTQYSEPSPDYFQYVDLGGGGLTPVGYGYRSIEFVVRARARVEAADALGARQEQLAKLDEEGVLATPANSRYNELVVEAGRMSILNEARTVRIHYEPEPRVELV
jgi:D-galacturonate reductase